MPPHVGKVREALLLSVCPSVCPSVAYIANNSRTQRPSVPKFGRKVPTLDATRIPISRSSKVKVTRPIRVPYLSNGTAYKLETRCTDGGWRPASVTGAMTSNIKGQGHKLTSSVRLISASSSFGKQNAVPVSLEAGGGIPCRPNPAATLVVYCNLFTYLMIYCTCIVWDTICHVNPS